MQTIHKARETMTAKKRVLNTFALEKTDRVTIGYEANEGVHRRLAAALGISVEDAEGVRRALGVDYRGVSARYAGPPLFKPLPDRRVNELEGCYMRRVEHASGHYWDFCDFPLADADAEAFASFPVPDPARFDYDGVAEQLRRHAEYAVYIGGAGVPDIINSNGRIMGMENILIGLVSEDPAVLGFVRRRAASALAVMERTLDRYKGAIDFMWLGEDLGTQHAPMIGLELFRRVLRPIHQQFVDLAKAYDLPVIVHSCGSSSWAFEDFIAMGIRGVDTLQPEATAMEPQYLKDTFGTRLCFRGCISTAGPLAFGTEREVVDTVRDTLAIMMPGYGYHFAPTHAIQDNTPTENVLAMYNAAHQYGVYR